MAFCEKVCDLPNDEGTVLAIGEDGNTTLMRFTLSSALLTHGGADPRGEQVGFYCGGRMSVIQVSEKKQVLVCKTCYLRHEVPASAVVVEDLRS